MKICDESTDFINKLEELIKAEGMSKTKFVKDFSAYAGISEGTVAGWLNKGRLPSALNIPSLCTYFNCDLEYLFGSQKERKKIDATITDRLGLAQTSILNISRLGNEEKIIIDLMFSNIGIAQTRQLLCTLFKSSMYLQSDINTVHYDVSVYPILDKDTEQYISDTLNNSTMREILKLQTHDAFIKLFDHIAEDDYFKENARQYFNKMLEIQSELPKSSGDANEILPINPWEENNNA